MNTGGTTTSGKIMGSLILFHKPLRCSVWHGPALLKEIYLPVKRGESSGISADCKLNDGDWMRPRLLWPFSTGPETGCNHPVTTRMNAARFLHHPPDGDEGRVCILMLEDDFAMNSGR